MDMKRFFLYAIAIAALALAGCGGNGGGTAMMDDMDDMDDMMQCDAGYSMVDGACVKDTTTTTPTAMDAMDLLIGGILASPPTSRGLQRHQRLPPILIGRGRRLMRVLR